LASSEPSDCVRQNIELSETRLNLINQALSALASRNLGRHGSEAGVAEIRLLYVP